MFVVIYYVLQAARRQETYEKSAVGKATMKAVKAVKEDRPRGRPATDTHQDWLN